MKKKFIYSLIPLIIISLHGCFTTPKEPVMPQWDVELNVPLVNKTLTMVEIIDSSNNPNLTIVDSSSVGDSIYFLVVDDINSASSIQDTLKIPIPLVPDTLAIAGQTGGGTITSAIIFNPDPDYHLYTAEFKRGTFYLHLNNNSASAVDAELIFPGFKSRVNGEVLSVVRSLNPGQTTDIPINLSDYNYKELYVAGINSSTTQASPGFYFLGNVTASGNVDVDFISEINSDEITLSRLSGSIKRTEMAYFETSIDTKLGNDIQDFESQVKFKEVAIQLHARTVGEMRNLKIVLDSTTVTAFNNTPSGMQLVDQLLFNGLPYYRNELIAGAPFSDEFNQDNTNINTFIVKLPDVITVGNKFILDKSTSSPDSLQAVSSTDSIKFTANIIAPVKISVKDASYSDTTEIEIDEDQRKEIEKGNSANLTLEVENAIGLGLIATASFLDENYNLLFKLRNADGSTQFVANPAEVNADGVPITPSISTITLELNKDEIEMFSRMKYVVAEGTMRSYGSTGTTFGPYVRVRAKDYVKYKMYGGVNYHVNVDDGNNN